MRNKKTLSLTISMVVLGANTAALPDLAFAQKDNEETELIEEITVTGSRIKKANLISSSPVTQIDADEILYQGSTRIEDLLNNLPQTFTGQSSGQANAATGTATVDLRGLKPERTLVLVDGRRLPAGSPIDDGIGADLNQIPAALVKRVEVLTGGASATYGSDAIAGVVNFIMVDDFEGIRIDYQNSFYQHENDDNSAHSRLERSGFEQPDSSVSDGDINDISFTMGLNLADGRGNITAYAGYRKIKAVLQSDRDYSACALKGGPGSFECGGSPTIPEGRFTDFGALNGLSEEGRSPEGLAKVKEAYANNTVDQLDPRYLTTGYDYLVAGDQFVPSNDKLYNYGPLNYYQRPDERYTAGVFGHLEFNEHAEVYTQMMFMDDRTQAQIAPSGAFFVTDDFNCGNPLLSDQQFDAICGQYGLDATQNISDIVVYRFNPASLNDPTKQEIVTSKGELYIGRRNVEGGPRFDDIHHTSYRGVFGIRGEINDNWSYDFYGQYSEVILAQTYHNDMSTTRITRALNVVTDNRVDDDGNPLNPETYGKPVCQSVIDGSDPNCVPWNIFQAGGVTPEAIDYLSMPLFARGGTDQKIISGYVTGNLKDYGVKLPAAETGVSVAFGLEYRSENLEYDPDQGFTSGDGAGQGGPTLGVKGGFDVKEIFAELSVPVIEGRPLAESVTLDLGYRYSDYSTDIDTDTYKVTAEWTPVSDIKMRASFQHAVRHANIRELFRPQALDLFGMDTDPCSGPVTDGKTAAGRTFEECARTGVTAAQFGNISKSGAGQYNQIVGGVADLVPEESDTKSVGIIYSPSYIENLTISLDYFDIEVDKAIDDIGAEFILNQCLDTGDETFCSLINRGINTGTLWIGEDGITNLDTNIGFFSTAGYDLIADYKLEIGEMGHLNFVDSATYLTKWEKQNVPGAPTLDCVGNWGSSCEAPKPQLVNNFRITWSTPWSLDLTGAWRHISKVDDLGTNKADFDAVDYFDMAALWLPTDNTNIRLGVNNVFDKAPPLTADADASIYGNGNTFPGVYDALGRYIFLGLSVNF